MRVFVTGATGFVGSAVTAELLSAGHDVLGLARSPRSATRLQEMGATVVQGSLEDPDSLRGAARTSDAVVHTAFNNTSLWRFPVSSRIERVALEAMAAELAGTGRPLVAAGGFAPVQGSGLLVEQDPVSPKAGPSGRNVERTIKRLAGGGVNASVVRMPCVHGDGDRFTLFRLIELARRHGRSPWVGDGDNLLPAVHKDDAASLYRLAIERGRSRSSYHAVAEQGVPYRSIAEGIARHLGVPTGSVSGLAALRHFGAMLPYVSRDAPASSQWTRHELGWSPTGPGLLDDLGHGAYFNEE